MDGFSEMLLEQLIDKIVENPYEYGIAIAPVQDGKDNKSFEEILKETQKYSSLQDYPDCRYIIVHKIFPRHVILDLYSLEGKCIISLSYKGVIPPVTTHELLNKTLPKILLLTILQNKGDDILE